MRAGGTHFLTGQVIHGGGASCRHELASCAASPDIESWYRERRAFQTSFATAIFATDLADPLPTRTAIAASGISVRSLGVSTDTVRPVRSVTALR